MRLEISHAASGPDDHAGDTTEHDSPVAFAKMRAAIAMTMTRRGAREEIV
jgi:hypothetical protein